MTDEQTVQAELERRFPALAGNVRVARARRVFAVVPADQFAAVLEQVVGDLKFCILCTITGLDLGENLAAVYHVARESGMVLSMEVRVPKSAPVLQTVTGRWPAAEMYEREMNDLLGMQVQGLPEGTRYPLPDGWPAGQYPLRKDWNAATLEEAPPPKETDHGG